MLTTMRLLRVKDVAEILACSRSEIYALKDAGKIPFCRIGGMVRFRTEDIDEFIRESLVPPRDRQIPASRLQTLKHLRS